MPRLTVCPDCAEPRQPDDKFCGGCGIDLAAAARPQAVTGPPPPHAAGLPDWALAVPVLPPPATAPPMPSEPPGPPASFSPGVPGAPATPGVPPAPDAPPVPSSSRAPHTPRPGAQQPPVPEHAPSDDSTTGPGGAPAARGGPPGAGGRPVGGGPGTGGAPPWPDPAPPGSADTLALTVPPAATGPGATSPAPPASPASPDPREPAEAPAVPEGPWSGRVCVACGTGGIDDDGYCEHCGHAQPRERDHMERELDGVAGVSDRGLRHHRNEDAFQISATSLPDGLPAVVAVVCDGVSSATRPDEASAAAAAAANDALLDALESGVLPEKAMHDALLIAAEAVNALSGGPSPDHNAPACTCVSAVVSDGTVTVGWVGDSRAYWVPDDRAVPRRLTEDDSWAARMVATGLMSEEDAYADQRAHAITGWLGADAVEVDPHTAAFRPDRPGVLVVCTDGLWNYAESAAALASAVPADARTRPLRSAQHLVGFALDSGGHDNVTVAVIPFPPAPGRAPAGPPSHTAAPFEPPSPPPSPRGAAPPRPTGPPFVPPPSPPGPPTVPAVAPPTGQPPAPPSPPPHPPR